MRVLTTMVLLALACGCASRRGDYVTGADISWITQMEREGKPMCDVAGNPRDCFELMRDYGLSGIRLRVWVDPHEHGGWCDANDLLVKAKRAQTAGHDIMVDFHYSDWWADPGKQKTPASWIGLERDKVVEALAKHTEDVLLLLKRNGVRVRWVQVGNETSHGMLWSPKRDKQGRNIWRKIAPHIVVPEMEDDAIADLYEHPDVYAACFAAGYDAVKRVYPEAVVIVHHADGCNIPAVDYNLEALARYGARWDMVGISLYPYHQKHRNKDGQKTIDECVETLRHVAERWNCDTMVVETGFECIPEKYEEGRSRLAQVIRRTLEQPRCRGVFYWEPQCNAADHYKLGAFDDKGRPTPIMDGFLEKNRH